MFFQEPTPDTSGYMIAGYVIAFLVMALYVASIYVRNRNLERDLSSLQEIEEPAPRVQTVVKNEPRKSPSRSANHRSAKSVTKKSRKKQS